jgi:phosphatidylserine decarboxylase
MPFAREGYAFVGIGAAITVIAAFAGFRVSAFVAFIVTLFFLNFFRDPEREAPDGGDIITSPADGRVVGVTGEIREERFVKGPCRRVSIFMSPLDVHVNRIPIDGTIVEVRHQGGKFHAAFLDKASELNEQNAVLMEDVHGERILFIQIAGQLARRIVCKIAPGDRVRRGDRYGMIMFGSRMDVFLPLRVRIDVKVGDRAHAGTTILGTYTKDATTAA